jgi:hypothetical protein
MQYQVPQFIDVEDKIFGPFTFKQFVYVAGGVGMCVIAFVYLPLLFAIIVSLPIAGIAGALAFYKVNGKPFIETVEAGFDYFLGGKLYLWKKEDKKPDAQAMLRTASERAATPVQSPEKLGLTANRLHDLAWSLDIGSHPPEGEQP